MQLSDLVRNLPPYHFADANKKIADRRATGVDVISLSIGDPGLPGPRLLLIAYVPRCRSQITIIIRNIGVTCPT